MRLNSFKDVKMLDIPLITVDAKKEFMEVLKGITDPELKRKAIGEKFIEFSTKRQNTQNKYKIFGY